MKVRIIKSARRSFDCLCLESGQKLNCMAKGSLLKGGEIVVGDYAELEKSSDDQYIIGTILERSNSIERFIVRERKNKIIAANIDVVVLVMAVSKPEYKRGLVDRYLIRSSGWHIPVVLVFNKSDEPKDESLDIDFEVARVESIVENFYEISAKDPSLVPKYLAEENNMTALKKYLKDKTALFAGQSGVGKSKTISALSGGLVNLPSNKIAKVGKGAHTTTWAEIIKCGDFYLVDSPGIRSFSLEDLYVENLPACFPDLVALFDKCKFNNCSHDENAANCFFNSLDDSLPSKAIKSRLGSFLRIQQELEKTPTWKKKKRK